VLAGVGILATDVTQADHRIGWALVAIGLGVSITCGLLFLVLSGGRKPEGAQPPISAPNSVISINQQGGQTARQITNVGLQPRTLQGLNLTHTVSRLSTYAGTEVLVCCLAMDGESFRFAQEIRSLLESAEWKVKPLNATLLGHAYRGVAVRCPDDSLPPALEELARSLLALGFHTEAAVKSGLGGGYEVLVLSN